MSTNPSDTLEDSAAPLDFTTTMNEDHSSSPSLGDSGLFFADATLDLSEAHDIADTPEPCRVVLTEKSIVTPRAGGLMEMPTLETPDNIAKETPTNKAPAAANKDSTSTANATMNRITSNDLPQSQFPVVPLHPPRRPRRPRDIPWAVSFVLIVPVVMLMTTLFAKDSDKFPSQLQSSVFYCIVLAYGATVILARLLYRTIGGGDGEDARQEATRILLLGMPVSVAVYVTLMILILTKTPHASLYAILPAFGCIRSLLALKKWQSHHLFFRALVSASLDISSRSLRRSSFYRMISGLTGLQLCMVVWWKLSVFGALSRGIVWLLLALLAGKWMTGTVARILGLIASGGIAHWFLQQSRLVQEMTSRNQENREEHKEETDDESDDYNVGYNARMPEEYRTADASIYQSVLDMDDEGIDDDFVDEDTSQDNSSVEWSSGSTCKSFLIAAVTISFGSVAQCGLLGGFAQWTWSMVRHADALLIHDRTFSRMQIGQDGRVSVSLVLKLVTQANVFARSFVRSHSDLAMCHVAAYYKSYQKAASDVMMLVDASGTFVLSWLCCCYRRFSVKVITISSGLSFRRGTNHSR